jgi:hypothetical protein
MPDSLVRSFREGLLIQTMVLNKMSLGWQRCKEFARPDIQDIAISLKDFE